MGWVNQLDVMVRDNEPYTAPDGTQYPHNFPRSEIPGLTYIEPTQAELDAQALVSARVFQQEVLTAVQSRLDAFAKTRNYDGILSACTYATSTVAKFKTEGQYCVDVRDQTWATLYQILDDVQNGIRTMPTDYQEVEPLLPVLVWPT